jgi:hypothetical protein
MEKNIKYQSELITIDSGQGAGTTPETKVDLDAQFDRCVGVQLHEVSNGGIANDYYRIGIKDRNGQLHDIVSHDSFKGGTSAPPNERYKQVTIPIVQGRPIQIQVYIPSALASDLVFELEFVLEEDLVKV